MQKSKLSALRIVGDFHKALLMVGPAATQKLLQSIHKDEKLISDYIANYIIGRVCRGFKISKTKLLNGTSKGNRKDALMVTYALLKNCINYTTNDIKEKLHKEKSLIRHTVISFNKLNEKIPIEKTIIEKYRNIEADVNAYIASEKERRKQCLIN